MFQKTGMAFSKLIWYRKLSHGERKPVSQEKNKNFLMVRDPVNLYKEWVSIRILYPLVSSTTAGAVTIILKKRGLAKKVPSDSVLASPVVPYNTVFLKLEVISIFISRHNKIH